MLIYYFWLKWNNQHQVLELTIFLFLKISFTCSTELFIIFSYLNNSIIYISGVYVISLSLNFLISKRNIETPLCGRCSIFYTHKDVQNCNPFPLSSLQFMKENVCSYVSFLYILFPFVSTLLSMFIIFLSEFIFQGFQSF